ncbi:hypothetical protein EXT91_26830, partial [Klebsiella quasipneumoniae subsp. similipneumoniae]
MLHQVHQAGGDFLCRLLFVAGKIAGLRQWAAVSRVIRVAQPQPVVGQAALDIINTAPLGSRKAGDPGAGFLGRFGAIE